MAALFLFRHARAEPPELARPDDERALTAEGRRLFVAAARHWARWIPGGSVLLASPVRRARETAALLAERLGVEARTEELLRHFSDPLDLLAALPPEPNLVLVSHMPLVGRLAAGLLTGDFDGNLPLKTGQGFWLEARAGFHGAGARLRAALAVEEAAALGGGA